MKSNSFTLQFEANITFSGFVSMFLHVPKKLKFEGSFRRLVRRNFRGRFRREKCGEMSRRTSRRRIFPSPSRRPLPGAPARLRSGAYSCIGRDTCMEHRKNKILARDS